MLPTPKRSKYKAVKVVVDGLTFDSRAEARRYQELRLLEKAGEISALAMQVPFILAPPVKLAGESRTKPALKYICDFLYRDARRREVIEDVKSPATRKLPAYRIKKHLMKSVHDIDIIEIGKK